MQSLVSDGTDSKLLAEIKEAQNEEFKLKARLSELRLQHERVRSELQAVEEDTRALSSIQERYLTAILLCKIGRYWKDFNDYFLSVRNYVEDRDSLRLKAVRFQSCL